jgi:hypothetical protein
MYSALTGFLKIKSFYLQVILLLLVAAICWAVAKTQPYMAPRGGGHGGGGHGGHGGHGGGSHGGHGFGGINHRHH